MQDFETTHFLNGFGHPGGKFRFQPDWRAIGPDVEGMPPLPDYAALTDGATAEHPLRLVTAPARQFLNSSFTMTPSSRQREGRPTLLIHPADAAQYGVSDGGGTAQDHGGRQAPTPWIVHARDIRPTAYVAHLTTKRRREGPAKRDHPEPKGQSILVGPRQAQKANPQLDLRSLWLVDDDDA